MASKTKRETEAEATDAELNRLRQLDLTIEEAIEALVVLYEDIYCVSRMGINSGLCDDFAWAVCELIDGAESHWGDELCDESADELDIELYGYHCFVAYEGRYYDSEEPTGVDNFQDLPCFSRGVP